MKFIKKKKTAAAEVSSSINSETDALAMSYKSAHAENRKIPFGFSFFI
jgi:hypothetical protein